MYYLLENNKIIDSNNLVDLPFDVDINIVNDDAIFKDHCSGMLLNIIKIKKQSENVYDLIDWNEDLVRVDNMIHQCKYFHRDLREEYIEHKWFNAIYKPNSKGDYIKAWEEKDDINK